MENGKAALFSNGRLESEYLTGIENTLSLKISKLPNYR